MGPPQPAAAASFLESGLTQYWFMLTPSRRACSGVSPVQIFFHSSPSSVRTMRAGTPAARVFGGTSRVTTAPAAMTAPLPIVTPGSTVAFPPIQTSSPIVMGCAMPTPLRRCRGNYK